MSTMPKRQQTGDREFDNSIQTWKVTEQEVAYRDGYVNGQSAAQIEENRRLAQEARIYRENARLQTNTGVTSGVILGIIVTLVAAVVGGVLYLAAETDNSSNPAPATTVPAPTPPNQETTVIERTIERTQEVVPAPSELTLPEVNIDLNPANEEEAAPAASEQTPPTPPAEPDSGQPDATTAPPAQ